MIGILLSKILSRFWESKRVKEFLKALAIEENYHTPKEGYVKSKASKR